MEPKSSNLKCPSCSSPLRPLVLKCEACDVKVEGQFQFNEFVDLPAEDLHFLRIFVHCEGRIRDMEPALGLSYPTIRQRLTQLKNKIAGASERTFETKKKDEVKDVLERLEKGEIGFAEAFESIKKNRP